MLVARITVAGSQIRAQKLMPITSGMVGARVEVSFDEAWEGFSKVFVWNHWNQTIDDMEASGSIPAEVLDRPGGWLRLGVYGTKDGRALPTMWVTLGSVESGADPSGDESANPALPVWAQLLADMEELRKHAVTDDEIAAAIESYLQENPVEVPEALPNPYALTLTGAVTATYDGNEAVSVEIPSSDCIPTPPTAEVGQTIAVKAVDENGKPQEWEMVDLSDGGGKDDYSKPNVKLIVDIAIPQDALPEFVEITEDIDGNPLKLRKFIIQTDIKSNVSYVAIGFNNNNWAKSFQVFYGIGHTYYFESRNNLLILNGSNGDYHYADGAQNRFGATMHTVGEVHSIKIPFVYTITSGTYIKIWEVVD